MVSWVRPRLRRALILIASLTTALMLMFLAYDRSEAFAVEGTTEADFVKAVVDDTNAYWANELGSLGYPYSPANLAFLYDAPVDSLCGPVYPSEGPLYCRYDATLYYPVNWTVPGGRALDQYGYSAVAFGVAHEIGHHVQEQMDKFNLRSLDNWTLIQQELQADCFAGLWARQANEQLGAGGIEAILSALVDLGTPSHGGGAERITSFGLGYNTGDLGQCLALTG
ncbi:MAG: uncharacterized protein QOI57_654 [Rubrobacteraceae bacterium]|jgi:predicted metalloprotease|nr:uncharacterized protein [Rubrobacteraceae bacterium]